MHAGRSKIDFGEDKGTNDPFLNCQSVLTTDQLWDVFFKTLTNRHPERSASQICSLTQRFMARSRRTPKMLSWSMWFGAFRPPKPENRILPAVRNVLGPGKPWRIRQVRASVVEGVRTVWVG